MYSKKKFKLDSSKFCPEINNNKKTITAIAIISNTVLNMDPIEYKTKRFFSLLLNILRRLSANLKKFLSLFNKLNLLNFWSTYTYIFRLNHF